MAALPGPNTSSADTSVDSDDHSFPQAIGMVRLASGCHPDICSVCMLDVGLAGGKGDLRLGCNCLFHMDCVSM